jgi:streptogramin lyase
MATKTHLGDFGSPGTSGGGLTIGPDGNVYVSSYQTNQILRYDLPTGAFIDVFAQGGGLAQPRGLEFGPDGNLYVASLNSHQVLRYDGATGAPLGVFASGLNQPTDVTFGADGDLYVTSTASHQVRRYDGSTGAHMGVFGPYIAFPSHLTFGPGGDLFVASLYDYVQRVDGTTSGNEGYFVSIGSGGLDGAQGLVFGNDGYLYVSSFYNDRVLRYNGTTGAYVDLFANRNAPTDLLVYTTPESGTLLPLCSSLFALCAGRRFLRRLT